MTDRMLRLALFLFPGYHFGAWRLPDAIPEIDLGIEHYVRAAQLAEADAVAKERGLTPFTAIQNEYNLLHRDDEADVLPLCEKLNRSHLLQACQHLAGNAQRSPNASSCRQRQGSASPTERFIFSCWRTCAVWMSLWFSPPAARSTSI